MTVFRQSIYKLAVFMQMYTCTLHTGLPAIPTAVSIGLIHPSFGTTTQ